MSRRRRTSELSPLFRSVSQAEILTLLFTSEAEFTVREIATLVGRDRSQTARDVGKLVDAGLLSARTAGHTRIVTANTASPVYDAVKTIVLHTYGPRHVIAAALAGVDGVTEAWIFGSWAARLQRERGMPPGDIDVLIVGTADPDDVWHACAQASRRVGRDVNARVVSPQRWGGGNDPFLEGVKQGPLVRLDLGI